MKKNIAIFFIISACIAAHGQTIECTKSSTGAGVRNGSEKIIKVVYEEKNRKYVHFKDTTDANPNLITQLDCAKIDEKTLFCADTIDFVYRYLVFMSEGQRLKIGTYTADESGRITGHYADYICGTK